ncbi:Acyl CoA binding protein, putative [Talaromyces stipitatus ATCC 10500]|uniref:Acyl CoA binding protein, putative n=1 Tax=Talaromyces stipitatus (strain ATCC 10500 / CBS 375.48 / QM 6759 / NRRL 1006) TaxID=441959 RepID=B8MJZ2_TALSN|nr:Acyl CoA binding protein, putative [Talaromyces stipitatus ATCC 10500]EED14809.1 Acyl CoA binding protein, putative [Talaromyces stipitatus ATCC 10500]
MSDSVDRVFVHALNTVKKIPRTGTARPPAAERLKLYGLYKQSMEGDVEGIMDRPVGDAPDVQAEREKWDAWYSQRGISRTEAKRRYITTLINTMHLYASQTAEARELVAELEFVWDQIKYNASSSTTSSSSPIQPVKTLPVVVHPAAPRRYASIDDRMTRSMPVEMEDQDEDLAIYRRRSGDSRLRVLSPVSQSDEADVVRSHRQDEESIDDDDNDDDEEEEEEEEEEEDFQEARDGTSFSSEPTPHDTPIIEENNNRTRKRRKRTQSSPQPNWRNRMEQALTKMTAEIAALREQLDSTHHHHHHNNFNYRKPSTFFRWLLSWGKWLLYQSLRQLLWHTFILSVLLLWLRVKGDRRLERKVGDVLFKIRGRVVSLLRLVPRRWPRLVHLPLL